MAEDQVVALIVHGDDVVFPQYRTGAIGTPYEAPGLFVTMVTAGFPVNNGTRADVAEAYVDVAAFGSQVLASRAGHPRVPMPPEAAGVFQAALTRSRLEDA